MTNTETAAQVEVPPGFFEEIAAQLQSGSAEEISEVVISTCISRGILHPDLEETPDDELRAEEMREVFELLTAVTAAVSGGTLVPSGKPFTDIMDPEMERVWESFADDSADPETAEKVEALIHGVGSV